MHNIFGEKFCLADPYSDWIPLFKKIQDFEVFQLRLGLYSLCQSTLIYTIGRNAQKELCYKELISPHAIEFYSDCCLQFRTSTMDAEKFCKQIQYQIVSFFCEGRKKESLSIDYELFNYDNKYPNEYYIRYRCPFVGLYKFK